MVATLPPLSHLAAKYKGPSSMGCRERGSHALDLYLTEDTSRMETARVKEAEEADTRIITKEGEGEDRKIIAKEEEANTRIIARE